jgi:hypothetical protein
VDDVEAYLARADANVDANFKSSSTILRIMLMLMSLQIIAFDLPAPS